MNVWRNGRALKAVLTESQEALFKAGLIALTDAPNDVQMDERERQLSMPLPAELRVFYQNIVPVVNKTFFDYGRIDFFPLHEVEWDSPNHSHSILREVALPDSWSGAQFLKFGYTLFFDRLYYYSDRQSLMHGTIFVTDHEDDGSISVLGECLADWMSRFVSVGCFEPSIAPASVDSFPVSLKRDFLIDHLRLNPASKWAAEKLSSLA